MDLNLIVAAIVLTISQFINLSLEEVTLIEPDSDSLIVAPGDEIEVVCEAAVGVNVDWKHNGVYVQRLSDYRQRYLWTRVVEPEDAIILHTLTIASAHFGDAGNLACVNMDNLFTDVSTVRIIVAMDEMFKSQLIVNPSDYSHELVIGSEFHLSCSGGQDSDVRWMQDGEILEETAIKPIVEKADGTFRLTLLTFLAVNETDAGSYQCVDDRKKWRASEEIRVQVVASDAHNVYRVTIFNISLVFLSSCILLVAPVC